MAEYTRSESTRRLPLLTMVLALLTTAFVWTVSPSPAPVHAAGETIISTFYVPLFEDNAGAALYSVNTATGSTLSSTTSITVAATGAIIYYDQWEDGYEAAANVKTQASTLVFGDGNTANGNAVTYCVLPRCAGDLLPAGAVLRLNNNPGSVVPGSISFPRSAATVVFDGRDKISSTDGLAVTHATWPTAVDALHSEMAAAFDTSRWGVNFVAPVGTNTPAQGSGTTSFNYTGIEVMARAPGTQVYIDANNNGTYTDAGDVNGTTIGEGQTVYLNGGVQQGAKVVASKPVQVFLMTGVIGSNYENRSFQVFPTEGLVNDYIAPASAARASGTPSYATVLYLFNPQATSITVTVQTSAGSTNYTIPAGSLLTPAPVLANGQTARVTSPSTFAALAGIGTRETAANSLNYDWGYSLLPARVITDSLVIGWAPGSQDTTVANYDPVWVTTLAPTTLYVDYDADPATGANVDPNGSRYDTSIVVGTALSQLRLTDTADNDMTGARVYTIDGTAIAAAYGEDPAATTPVAFPGIDLGTTLFPACGAMCVRKLATISVDIDGDGLVDPGDTLRWSVEAVNTDYYPLINPVLFDSLPGTVTYVPGSTQVSVNGGAFTPVADDVVPPATSLFPYDESGRQITATIPVGGSALVTFDTVVDPAFSGTSAICNRAIVTSQREIILTPANGADTGCSPVDGLRITKTSNSGGNPVLPGQALSYTLTVTNQSSSAVSSIAVTDPLPAGLTWSSTSVTRPATSSTTIADNFQTAGSWAGSTGATAWSAAAWTETDTGGTAYNAGFLQKVTDVGDLSGAFLSNSPLDTALTRVVGNLSTYSSVTLSIDTRCGDLENTDAAVIEIRKDASSAWQNLGTWTNCDAAAYTVNNFTLTAAQFGTATELRFRVSDAFSGASSDAFYFDNVVFSASARVTSTVAGAAPPNLVTLVDLLPSESATIVVNTTVNNPYTATDELTNIATVRSGNQVAKATVIDCVRCFDYSDDPSTYNGSGGLSPARARTTSPRTYIADTFQAGGYSGSTGTAPWAGAAWVEAGDDAVATTGIVQNVVDASTRSARIGSATVVTPLNTALSRVVGDLSSYTAVNLGFDYRCGNMTTGDVVQLQIRPTAAAAWTTLQTFSNCNNATIYSGQDLTLAPATYGTATEIRLVVTNAFTTNVFFYFDDVQIRAIADTQTTGPRLGTIIDREVQGTGGASPFPATSPAAPTGDDSGGSDDEDGVVVPAVDVNTMDIPITVTDADGGVSYVNGWFDWSNDGTFGAGESLFDPALFVSATGGLTVVGGAGQVPGPGTYTVTVNVPNLETNGSGYAIGATVYSRFRVATLLSGVSSPTGASADGEVEDYSTTLNTLPVTIAHVQSAQVRGGQVAVEWRTAQEVNNLGFNLYAERADGTLQLLTDEIVVSKAPTSVESQDYTATVATSSAIMWLEDIALDGTSQLHGPYKVGESYGDEAAPEPIDWAAVHAQTDVKLAAERRAELRRAQAASKERVLSPFSVDVGPVAKLAVTDAGVQQVTYEQLVAAGVDLAGVPADALAVTDQAGPVQIEVLGASTFGPGSAIRFIGQPLDTIYTGTNVYRVHVDPSLARRVAAVGSTPPASTTTTSTTTTVPAPSTTAPPRRGRNDVSQDVKTDSTGESAPAPGTTVADVKVDTSPSVQDPNVAPQDIEAKSRGGGRPTTSTTTTTTVPAPSTTTPAPVVPATQYTESLVVDDNHEYSVAAPGADPWYDQLLVSTPGVPATGSTTATLTDPVAGAAAHVAVELWGITRDPIVDDHHAQLRVNGVLVADARFDDNRALRLEGAVAAGVLVAGANTLEVTLLDDTGVSVDIVAINSWTITYERSTVAVDGRLDLTVTADRVDVAGMPAGEVVAFGVAADGSITKLAPAVAGGVLQVPGSAAPTRYVLSAASSLRSPAVSPARAYAGLMQGSADYLIITNGIFTAALAPLIAYHEAQGRTVKVVDVADVYEQYSGGVVDAAAIDRYLAEAVRGLGLRWVLLVGADSVDYRDFDGDGSFSLMPSQYGATGFDVTFAPIDPAYADTDGDGVPDVALGRLPARTPAELSTMISKTLAYAGRSDARSLLMVSDANDGIDYAAANDAIADRFDGWDVRRSDVDRDGVDAAHAELMAALNDGVAVTFYVGHSGTSAWTEVGLFDTTTAATLTNAVPTLVVQFGCWNTYYVAPDASTLAHGLMLDPDGGAAAVMGSSTLTSAANDIQLADYLADELATGTVTIGEAVLAAKHELQMHAGGATSDVQLGWTILGDPAMPAGGHG